MKNVAVKNKTRMHYEAAITSQPLTLNRSASRVPFRKKQRFFRKIFALFSHSKTPYKSSILGKIFDAFGDAFFAKVPYISCLIAA